MRYSDWKRYDESGVPQTCPLIDTLIDLIKDSDCDQKAIEILEKIRSHNENLRQWGAETNYELSERVDELEYELKQLQES
jgi:hypothetical protein